ncbi:MAG: lipopolysaccharide biosynthesis protein, partial [Acidobacteriaceae bacterium]
TLEDALVSKFDLRKIYGTRYRESARKVLASNTTITEDRKSGVITIRVRDKEPWRAQAICRAYIDELTRLSTQLSTTAARREREFLEQRLQIAKREVGDSEAKLGEFSSKNSTVDIPQQSKAMVEATATLQGRLIAAEAELEGLKKVYGDQNVRVKTLQGNVDELRRNLRELSGTDTSVTSTSGLPSLRKLPILGVTYVDLLRQTKISESVLEALTKQYELAKVQEAKDIPSVRMLDEPNLPERKAFPPRTLIAILGAFLGCGVALAWTLWNSLDPLDSKRELVDQIYSTVREDVQFISRRMASLTWHP